MRKPVIKQLMIEAALTAAVIAVALPLPDLAFAAGGGADLQGSVSSVQSGISKIPQIVAGLFYIGGSAMIGAGALKLKAHSENPTQTPIGHGLGRIVAGAALLALPSFGLWLNSSLNIGQNGFSEQSLGTLQ